MEQPPHYKKFQDSFNQSYKDKQFVVEKLFNIFNRFKNKEVIQEWLDGLERYHVRDVEKAVEYCFKNISKMPSFSEFRNCIPRTEDNVHVVSDDHLRAVKQTNKRREQAESAKMQLKAKGFSDSDITKYVKIFIEAVYGKEFMVNCSALSFEAGVFRDQALSELFKYKLDSKKAIVSNLDEARS